MSNDTSEPTSRTDWTKVAALSDAEIDTSDIASLNGAFFAQATLRMPNLPLVEVTLHIDPYLLRWFQEQGAPYEQLMNEALQIYFEAHSFELPSVTDD